MGWNINAIFEELILSYEYSYLFSKRLLARYFIIEPLKSTYEYIIHKGCRLQRATCSTGRIDHASPLDIMTSALRKVFLLSSIHTYGS